MTANPKKIKPKNKKMGSAKGIETMYRNAYRTELDLIALAATKSNIMISLNGFIVSALMISGGVIDIATPLLIPTAIFLSASALSIYFALLAASPSSSTPCSTKSKSSLFERLLRKKSSQDTPSLDPHNILIYEDRAKLSKPDYLKQMRHLLNNQDKVYESMSDQLYWLGEISNQKFKMLKISYAILRWGILFAVVSFSAVKVMEYLSSTPPTTATITSQNANTPVLQFKKIYEPSAAQQLSDGKLLILEDESKHALNVIDLKQDETFHKNKQISKELVATFNHTTLDDLEGVALGGDGYIYASTSFSRSKKGKRLAQREQLLRFKIDKGKLVASSIYMDFGDFLRNSKTFNQILQSHNQNNPVDLYNINIEALSFNRKKDQLLLGFRKPLIEGKSMIVRILNPLAIFNTKAQPILSNEINLLDLNGGGIRALNYDANLGSYLIANEVKNSNGKKRAQLWLWSGEYDDDPTPLNIPSVAKMKNIEAITQIKIKDKTKVLLLSDDGNREKKRPAHYLVLDYKQIRK